MVAKALLFHLLVLAAFVPPIDAMAQRGNAAGYTEERLNQLQQSVTDLTHRIEQLQKQNQQLQQQLEKMRASYERRLEHLEKGNVAKTPPARTKPPRP